MTRPALLTIRPQAMAHNLQVVRSMVGRSKIWAVAKANAYGHGIAAAIKGLEAADGLAVLDIAEAQTARNHGWEKPILLIEGPFRASDLRRVHELNLSVVIHQPAQVQMVFDSPHPPQQIWVKLNTGMNRLGFGADISNDKLLEMINLLQTRVSQPLGWMTHFANADLEEGWCDQAQHFHERHAQLLQASRGFSSQFDLTSRRGPISLANSAAVLSAPATHADWVRPGIMLYGATPFDWANSAQRATAFNLKATQVFSSEIIGIQNIKTGQTVGYGSRFMATRPTRVGIVAAGYADGYPRIAPDGTPVWVAGQRVPIIGRVSMDMITVDLTDHPSAELGAMVELWGDHIAIDEVAHAAGTVGYELMCKVTQRVARVVQA
jgi:alanine racemase